MEDPAPTATETTETEEAAAALSGPATAALAASSSADDDDDAVLPSPPALAYPPPTNEPDDVPDDAGDDGSVASDVTDGAIAAGEADDDDDAARAFGFGDDDEDLDDDADAAPGHLHALSDRVRSEARLRGMSRHNSEGKLGGGEGRRSRSASRSRGGRSSGRRSANSSRSSSPLPKRPGKTPLAGSLTLPPEAIGGDASSHKTPPGGGSPSVHSGRASHAASSHAAGGGGRSSASVHSAHSSFDGAYLDPDILLDRLGFVDLDPPLPHEIRCGPLAAPDGGAAYKGSGGLTSVNERLSEETLEDCHAFHDLVAIDDLRQHVAKHVPSTGVGGGMSSTLSMPSVAHSSLSGLRSDVSVGSLSNMSVGSYGKGGHSRGGSVAGGSLLGDGEDTVLLGTLEEEEEEVVEEEEEAEEEAVEEEPKKEGSPAEKKAPEVAVEAAAVEVGE